MSVRLPGDQGTLLDALSARATDERWAARLFERDTSLWTDDPEVAETIAEQRLLWHLRHQTVVHLCHPPDLDLAQENVPRPARAAVATLRAGELQTVGVPRLVVEAGEHLLVTGANGSGKSTLLKVLAGVLAPTYGHVDVGARQAGYLPQDVTFRRPDRSAAQLYEGVTGSPVALHDLGLLHPRDLHRPVGVLSLGQQRRLALAVLVAQAPDLLLLDEPTNHISLTLAEELEESLQRSPGTVVVASHDRWLRRRWSGSQLVL